MTSMLSPRTCRLRWLWPASLPMLLAGCLLGPDYTRPEVAPQATAQPQLPRAGQAGVVPATPPSPWWQQLHDPLLDALVGGALRNSPNLRAAQARLLASRALQRQRRAEQLPSVGAAAGYARVQAPDALEQDVRGLGERIAGLAQANGRPQEASQLREQFAGVELDSELYLAGFDASWELDLFGRRRRAAEQAAAEADAEEAALADAQVQLAAELTQAYLAYRSSQQRIALAQDNLQAAQQSLELVRQRRSQGADSDLQVERAQAQLQQQRAALPPLQAQADEARDALALMVGRKPGALDARLQAPQPLPALPAQIAVDDAAAAIRRRPDVRRAERALAASSAQIGQALSAYFPQVNLLGSIGAAAASPSGLGADSAASVVAPFLRWSLFDSGVNKARVAQARAGNQARLAAYEATVLAALRDANTALARFGAARQQLQASEQAQASAERAAALMAQRRQAGAASQIDLLDVQRQRLQAQDAAAQAQLQLLVCYVALQKSLGLGWQQAPSVVMAAPSH